MKVETIDDLLRHTEEQDECLVWKGSKNKEGYGVVRVDKRPFYAHRLSYELAKHPIPPNRVIMHSCDNPSCINPDHLRCGTHADNVRDKVMKGRGAFGEKHGHAKLTIQQVRWIRSMKYWRGMYSSIARQLEVKLDTVRRAYTGEHWNEALDA